MIGGQPVQDGLVTGLKIGCARVSSTDGENLIAHRDALTAQGFAGNTLHDRGLTGVTTTIQDARSQSSAPGLSSPPSSIGSHAT